MNQITRVLAMTVLILTTALPLLAATESAEIASGTALKPDDIREEPFRDATTTGALEKGDPVSILEKDGGWLKIASEKGNGWVRLLSIRRADMTKASVTVEGILSLASGRAGTGNIVATTGIRGLTPELLRLAKFHAARLARLESYAVTRTQARKFADQGGLKAVSVPYLAGDEK
ncbi:MAG TPA: SH3 domain-containing protein [Candidatus Ozemobacteraceae bacterium]|nr:SH3 domain-containing protein [Candidatus Ozemobacteraceae bacterium]